MDSLIMADNFLTQLLTNMQSQLSDLRREQDENHRDLTEKIEKVESRLSSRIGKLEGHEIEKKDLPDSPLHNPKVINILFFVSLTVLLIVGAVVGIDLRALL